MKTEDFFKKFIKDLIILSKNKNYKLIGYYNEVIDTYMVFIKRVERLDNPMMVAKWNPISVVDTNAIIYKEIKNINKDIFFGMYSEEDVKKLCQETIDYIKIKNTESYIDLIYCFYINKNMPMIYDFDDYRHDTIDIFDFDKVVNSSLKFDNIFKNGFINRLHKQFNELYNNNIKCYHKVLNQMIEIIDKLINE